MVVVVALIISITAIAVTPLLQSTGLASKPLAEKPDEKALFLQDIIIKGGALIFINTTKTIVAR